jgi:hypothetical protein
MMSELDKKVFPFHFYNLAGTLGSDYIFNRVFIHRKIGDSSYIALNY